MFKNNFSGFFKDSEKSVESVIDDSFKVSDEERAYAEKYPSTYTNLLITDNVSYEVLEETDTSVTLKITAPDMTKIMNGVVSEYAEFDDENEEMERIQNYVIDKLKSGSYDTITSTVTIQTEKDENGEKSIVPSEEYFNAIYGGLYSYYNDIQSKMKEKQ